MSAPVLPISTTHQPTSPEELAAVVRAAHEGDSPLYPIGGGTSLDYGLPAKEPGAGLSLAGLNRVIDYPARDMTVTVEAGVTMRALAELLAQERQQLPLDVPQAAQATVGGVIATNFNGPRRFGYGSVRDYVIGVSAVDGRGTPFKGGGRVVKNVAGYDFCKLLTGSLGTLGVITQATLKLKPLAEETALVACAVPDYDAAERVLAGLMTSAAAPTAIELLAGPAWADDPLLKILEQPPGSAGLYLVVALEGTANEVDWMTRALAQEWRQHGITTPHTVTESDALLRRLIEFPALPGSPLVLRASLRPSGTTHFVHAARRVDPQCSVQAQAGNGSVTVRFAKFPEQGLARTLVGQLQPAAAAYDGHVVVLSNPGGSEMTHQCVWGGAAPLALMARVQAQFDPRRVLNRGRFVYWPAS